jgi:hypothetical protein
VTLLLNVFVLYIQSTTMSNFTRNKKTKKSDKIEHTTDVTCITPVVAQSMSSNNADTPQCGADTPQPKIATHVISFILFTAMDHMSDYKLDEETSKKMPDWSPARYVVGLIECLRVCKILIPDYTVAIYMPEDTMGIIRRIFGGQGASSPWGHIHSMLVSELGNPSVDIHLYKNYDTDYCYIKEPYLIQCGHRFQVLSDYSTANIIMVRDADSPPTVADIAVVKEWERGGCPNNILAYCLPNWGAYRCGGGMTFSRPAESMPMLHLVDHYRELMKNYVIRNTRGRSSCLGLDECWLSFLMQDFDEFFGDNNTPTPKPPRLNPRLLALEFEESTGIYYYAPESNPVVNHKGRPLYLSDKKKHEYTERRDHSALFRIDHKNKALKFNKSCVVLIDRMPSPVDWTHYENMLKKSCRVNPQMLDTVTVCFDSDLDVSISQTSKNTHANIYGIIGNGYRDAYNVYG